MAKKKIHIDELFRRELGDMKMPVDTNDWATMQAQIAAEQNKRKRRALWWWFAGIALLVVGSLTTYYFLSPENSQRNQATLVQNTTPSQSIDEAKENNTTSQEKTKKDNTTLNQQTNSKETTTNNTETNTDDKPVSSSKQSSFKKETKKPKISVDPRLAKQIQKLKDRRNGNPDGNMGDDGGGMDTPYPNSQRKSKPKQTPKPSATENKDNTTPKETTTTKVVTPDSTKTNSDSAKQAKEKKPHKSDEDDIKPKLSPFSIGFSLGSALNSFVAEENSDFGKILNNGNQPALGFNALISANYAIKDFEINSGLGINSITNSGNYNYTHQTFDSIPVKDPQGAIIGYFYTNFRDTTHNFTLQSRFTSITLPIGLSYNISLGNNDNSGLRLGANTSINYLVGASGKYINPFNLFRLNVSDNKDLFRKLNIGLGASVGYYHKIGKQWTFEGSLNYNTLTNGIFDNKIGTAIRPSSIGVNVGIRYNFKLRK